MNKTVNTKLDARAEKVQTSLTLNFDGVTQEQLQELAARSAIIAWQAKVRSEGVIPTEATFNVAEVFEKKPRGPVDPVQAARNALAKMTDEERAAFLASLG